jgi:CheY-like chemotaxis protein
MTESGEKPKDKETDSGAKPKDKKTTKIDDWMVRISFAEAGEADMGFKATGLDITRKTKLALDKIMVVRSEREAARKEEGARGEGVSQESEGRIEPVEGKVRVMVLDDEPIVGKRLQPALAKYGFEVEVFTDPTEALARFDEQQFDIVVTDLRMEGVDGIEILEHVMSRSKNTRVILITGYATVEVAREALVKGAFDFIAKPFKPKDLRAVINKAALSLGHKGIV